MGQNVTQKIIAAHLEEGTLEPGGEIAQRIDQTLTQDATGTISLRTVPRNFPGRSGTRDDQVYLCSPETAEGAAITDEIIPAGAWVLSLRSNIPRIADFVFDQVEEGTS